MARQLCAGLPEPTLAALPLQLRRCLSGEAHPAAGGEAPQRDGAGSRKRGRSARAARGRAGGDAVASAAEDGEGGGAGGGGAADAVPLTLQAAARGVRRRGQSKAARVGPWARDAASAAAAEAHSDEPWLAAHDASAATGCGGDAAAPFGARYDVAVAASLVGAAPVSVPTVLGGGAGGAEVEDLLIPGGTLRLSAGGACGFGAACLGGFGMDGVGVCSHGDSHVGTGELMPDRPRGMSAGSGTVSAAAAVADLSSIPLWDDGELSAVALAADLQLEVEVEPEVAVLADWRMLAAMGATAAAGGGGGGGSGQADGLAFADAALGCLAEEPPTPDLLLHTHAPAAPQHQRLATCHQCGGGAAAPYTGSMYGTLPMDRKASWTCLTAGTQSPTRRPVIVVNGLLGVSTLQLRQGHGPGNGVAIVPQGVITSLPPAQPTLARAVPQHSRRRTMRRDANDGPLFFTSRGTDQPAGAVVRVPGATAWAAGARWGRRIRERAQRKRGS